jgi:hypothetical protein
VDAILVGSVGRLDDVHTVALDLIALRESRAVVRASVRTGPNISDLLPAVEQLTSAVFDAWAAKRD